MEKKKENDIDFNNYIHLYIKNWKLILASFFIIGSIGLAVLIFAEREYKVTANILLRDDDKTLSVGSAAKDALMKSFGSGGLGLSKGPGNVSEDISVITSHTLLTNAVRHLNLEITYRNSEPFDRTAYYRNSPIEVTPLNASMTDTLTNSIKVSVRIDKKGYAKAKAKSGFAGYKTIGKTEGPALPLVLETTVGNLVIKATPFYEVGKPVSIKAQINNKEKVADLLIEKEIIVEPLEKGGDIVALSTTQKEKGRERGKDILNTLITLYDSSTLNEKKDLFNHTVSFVQERLDQIEEELSYAEKNIENYKLQNQLSDVETEVKLVLEKNSDHMDKAVGVETQLNIIDMISKYIARKENQFSQIPGGMGIDDKSLSDAIQLYNETVIERSILTVNANPNNPTLLQLNERVNMMRENVIASINNVKTGLLITQQDLKKQELLFLKRLKNMPTQEREFIDIKRNQLIKEQVYLFLYEKREENALMLNLTRPKVKIIDMPYVVSKPVFPKAKIILMLVFVLTLFLSLIYVAYLDMFGKNVYSPSVLKSLTALPIVILKNLKQLKESLPYAQLPDGLKENYEIVSLKIHKSISDKNLSTIAITSFNDSDTSSAMACVLGQNWSVSGKRCILVDLNFKSPSLQRYLGVQGSDGLSQYLQSETTSPASLPVKINKYLDCIVINKAPNVSSSCLMGDKMNELMNYLKSNYDYVLTNMPPLGKNKASLGLYKQFDATLYVCEEDNVTKNEITDITNETGNKFLMNTIIAFGVTD